MKKIYSILITLIILISMSMGSISSAATVSNTQEIKIDGTIGHTPCWGTWSKWRGSGYTPYV